MSAIFKAIHEFDKRIEARAEHFAFKHPYGYSCVLYSFIPTVDSGGWSG